MKNDVLLAQKNYFETALIDLSQTASDLSDQIVQHNKDNIQNSSTMDFNQLSLLHSFISSIDMLSNVYQSLYHNSIDLVIKENNKHYKNLHKTIKHSILKSQEKERQRIAADLHDSVVQNMVHLSQQIEIVQRCMDKDPISSKLELASMKKNIKEIINDIRNTIFNLRPMTFDDIGWDAAFIQLKEMIEINSDCSVLLEINKPVLKEQLYLITIYRIVREACINAMKHANASQISIKIHNMDSFVKISIEDNGIGFSLDSVLYEKGNHFGLDVMRERIILLSGDYNIVTGQGKGTKIEIKIPV